MTNKCIVYRCGKQPEMYLYLRAGMETAALPEPLRQRTGRLTEVMQIDLDSRKKLARVDIEKLRQNLAGVGYYLQLPPAHQLNPHLNDSD